MITLNLSISLLYLIRYYVQKQTSWGDLMRNSSENMQHIYRRTPMQKCDFNKIALDRLLLKPGPRPWTGILDSGPEKNLDPEKPDSWKTWETDGCKKKIGRPQSIIYYNTKILKEETCKWAIWKNSYWGFFRNTENE